MSFSELPPETLTEILEALAAIDLLTLLTSQAVCRRFHTTIQSILLFPSANANSDPAQLAIHPTLESRFYTLFNSDRCLNDPEGRNGIPDLGYDVLRPFQKLPWAQIASKRALYLRPEASWRHLRLTKGRHIITKLDLCKVLTAQRGTSMKYFQVDLPPSGLTMGVLYDLLLSPQATMYRATRRWRLLLGKHISSYDKWNLVAAKKRYPSERQLMTVFSDDQDRPHSAVILVQGLQTCTDSGISRPREEGTWYPETTGEIPDCFPWQGCALPRSGLPGMPGSRSQRRI